MRDLVLANWAMRLVEFGFYRDQEVGETWPVDQTKTNPHANTAEQCGQNVAERTTRQASSSGPVCGIAMHPVRTLPKGQRGDLSNHAALVRFVDARRE